MPHKFRTTRRVEWADTDAAGIIHFASYFRYMEQAEHELLRSLGLSVMMHCDGQQVTWPRVRATCEFLAPTRFDDVLDIHVTLGRRGRKSLTYDFLFSSKDVSVARGQIVAVCCRKEPDKLVGIPIPGFILSKIDSLLDPETE